MRLGPYHEQGGPHGFLVREQIHTPCIQAHDLAPHQFGEVGQITHGDGHMKGRSHGALNGFGPEGIC